MMMMKDDDIDNQNVLFVGDDMMVGNDTDDHCFQEKDDDKCDDDVH